MKIKEAMITESILDFFFVWIFEFFGEIKIDIKYDEAIYRKNYMNMSRA